MWSFMHFDAQGELLQPVESWKNEGRPSASSSGQMSSDLAISETSQRVVELSVSTVYMYVYLHVYVYIYIYTYSYRSLLLHALIHVLTCVCIYIHTHTSISVVNIVYTYTCMYVRMYVSFTNNSTRLESEHTRMQPHCLP